MENNNNDQSALPAEVQLPSISDLDAKDTANEISPEQLGKIIAAMKAAQPTNFKQRMRGTPGTAKPKISKSWHNGEPMLTSERNKLTWEEIHASNNVIRKG